MSESERPPPAPPRTPPRRARTALWAAAAFFVALVLLSAWQLDRHGRQEAITAACERVERHVATAVAALNRNLLAIDMLLAGMPQWVQLARRADVGVDGLTLQRMLRGAAEQNLLVRDVVLLDESGRPLAAGQPATLRQPPALPPGFAQSVLAQSFPALAVSAAAVSPTTTEPVLYLARRVPLPQGGRGLAVAEVQMPLLVQVLGHNAGEPAITVTLERDDGELLAAMPQREALLGRRLQPPLQAADADGKGRLATARTSGVPAMVAALPTLYRPLMLATDLPLQPALAGWRSERRMVWSAAVAFALLIVFAVAVTDAQWQRLWQARASLDAANNALEQQVAERTAKLAEREALLRLVTDKVPVVMGYRDLDGRILFANERYAKALGLPTTRSVVGQCVEDLLPPASREMHRSFSERANAGERVRYEAPMSLDPTGTVEIMLEPDRGPDGQVRGVFAAAVDVTQRKRAEAGFARTHADLMRFAEAAAHHLMEPSRRLASYTQRLRQALEPWPAVQAAQPVAESMGTLEREARRLQALVRDVQRYLAAGAPRGAPQAADVHAVAVALAEQRACALAAHEATLKFGELPPARIDRARLADLLTELIDNALVHGRPARPDQPHRIRLSAQTLGRVNQYRLADSGPGLPVAYRERVFGIFERLSGEGLGTGIGLALARRIVESVDGRIWIECAASDREGAGDGNTTGEASPEGVAGGTVIVFELPAA